MLESNKLYPVWCEQEEGILITVDTLDAVDDCDDYDDEDWNTWWYDLKGIMMMVFVETAPQVRKSSTSFFRVQSFLLSVFRCTP